MQILFAVIGAMVCILLATAFTAYTVQCAWGWLGDRAERRWEALLSAQFARRLRQDAYWFSEDPKTQHLLDLIAAQLEERGTFYINAGNLRDHWRQFKLNESAKNEAAS